MRLVYVSMEKIKLKIKKELLPAYQKYQKYMGIAWLVSGIFTLFNDSSVGWFYIALGAIQFLFHTTINNQILPRINQVVFQYNSWFACKTDLTKATYVKKFAGDVTFFLSAKEIRIDTQQLEKKSIKKLDQFIDTYQIPCKITPIR